MNYVYAHKDKLLDNCIFFLTYEGSCPYAAGSRGDLDHHGVACVFQKLR
jgi:hypothetical protein